MVFYSGDDAQNEYLYKFVSAAPWDPADANPLDRLATGAKYMDRGTLYVARFNDDGSGVWLSLTPDSLTPEGIPLSACSTTWPASCSTPVAPPTPWAPRPWIARNGRR